MARILIVDDALMVREVLAKTVATAGHEVVGEAASGREALAVFQEVKPDVVVLDLNMPAGDGFEALGHIRAADPSSRVIIVSALARTRSIVVRALKAGAVDVLAKPFNPQRLLDSIASAVGSGGQEAS
jgi:two-component system, chemotaxis family, chemotaxis protein CheY